MSIYRNQAQRVMDYISSSMKLPKDKIDSLFKINIDKIENSIQSLVRAGMNGKAAADHIIKIFNGSHPDYIQNEYNVVHKYASHEFRMKVLSSEIIVFFQGEKGDYLHSFKHDGRELDNLYKDIICNDCLTTYNKK